ncbi:TPA: hypothetical protein ACXE7D_003422 [Klebsiella pneumoniae]
MPPSQPVADSEPVALQPELAKVIYHFRDWNEGFPVERFKADYVISWMLANYPPAQPAPVVSAELLHTAASAIEDLLTTKDRTGACVWFDLPFRLRSAANAHSAPVVPDDVSIFEAAIEECKTCDSIDEHAWNHGVLVVMAKYESCRAAMLAAATQSPGSEPATMPGKWIPVSEQKPDCWCLTCRPVVLNDMRFVVCPDCGNKRCPRANDHRNACTGSNEPGQEGGAYPDTPQEVKP